MAQRNRTKLAVLGFLTWRPMSGYEIKKAIEGSISNFWSESYGQLYPILQQLAAEGLATRDSRETEGGRPQHIYAITEAGRAALRAWLAEPAQREPTRSELLLKLFFGRQSDIGTSIKHVEASEQRARGTIAKYEAIARQITTNHGARPDAPYWLMTLRLGLALNRAVLEWTAETLGELKEMEAGTPCRPRPTPASGNLSPRPRNHAKPPLPKPRARSKRA